MNPDTLKFIRCYVMRVYNDCNLLTYSRGIKDTDNNYFLLRIKDFLSDLFFCIFSGKNNEQNKIDLITIQDIFIIMHLVTETGKIWLSIKNYDNRNEISKKIECILNYIKVKPNDMYTFVNQDLEYYNYLIDYFDFYLEKFVDKIENNENENVINNNSTKENNKIDIDESNPGMGGGDIIKININNENNNLNNKEGDNSIKSKKINNVISINNNNYINTDKNVEEKCQNLLAILILLNNIYFRVEHEKTKHLMLNIIKIINDLGEEDMEKQIEVLNSFYNLKHKENLNKKIINEIQVLYVNSLIQQNKFEEADIVIKNSLKTILPNTKEEETYFILNFYLLLQQKNCETSKLGEMFEIVIQHQELNIEDLNEIFIHIYNHEYKYYLLKLFCEELCYNSNNINRNKNKNDINNKNNIDNNKYLNSKIELSFNSLTSMPEFVLIFNYLFIDAFINSEENELNNNNINNINVDFSINYKDIEKIVNNENFFELIKVMSEALLENTINNLYPEHKLNIAILLHNLLYLFLNKVKNINQSNFANYFLIDIINKFKKNNIELWKEFSLMSIQLYIEKKDYNKLKSIIKELETDKKETKTGSFIFAKIISILGEGIKWNSINFIEQLCQALNESEDFEILYYIKIFRFIYDNRINDIFLLSIILEKYCSKNIEIYNNYNSKENSLKQLKYANYNYSMIDCCYEVLFYCSHFNNFCSKIDVFCEILENIAIFMENFKYEQDNLRNKIILSNISVVSELIKLFINFKNLKDFKNGKYYYPDYMISNISKLLNFIFLNFEKFLTKEYLQNISGPITYNSLLPVTILFSFFQNSKIFTFSSKIKELINEKNKEKDISIINNKYNLLKDKFKEYQQNFVNEIKIYTNIIQDFDNATINKNKTNSNNNDNKTDIEEINLIKPKINQYLTNIYNENKTYDEIIMIKLTLNSEKDNLKNYILNIINKNYQDKKFMMIVNSILFCEGFKDICFFLINELINKIIITNTDELFNKYYTTNDIFDLYKELFNLSDENDIAAQIKSLKNYQIFLCKLIGKIDDSIFYQNTEWIYYQVFQLFEKGGTNLDKKTINYSNLKSIFDEINNLLIGKEKTFVIEGLIDLIIKKTM